MPRDYEKTEYRFKGPEFLWKDEVAWPNMPPNLTLLINDPEMKKTAVIAAVNTNDVSTDDTMSKLLCYFSSWERLTKAVAWLLRFKCYLVDPTRALPASQLSVVEIEAASQVIIRYVQDKNFATAFRELPDHDSYNPVTIQFHPKRSMYKDPRLHPLRMLSPIVVEGVLRVGGRLQRSELPEETKHPIILPAKGNVTELIVNFYHVRDGHSGTLHTLACVRKKFWIIRGQTTVRNTIKKCVHCRLLKAKPCSQIMAPFPVARLTAGNPPFTCVGVDYLGLLIVKRARSQIKRFGCVFTCFAARAVHLEIAYSLDTSSFLQALHRFIARRGPCKEMYSDNGTNFVGADRELREGIKRWNQDVIQDDLRQAGLK